MTDILTRSESAVLALLDANRGRFLTPAEIVTIALGYAHPGAKPEPVVRAHVFNLRRKGVAIGSRRLQGYYVGTLPRPTRTYSRECEWCSALFTEPVRQARRYRYCPRHRHERVKLLEGDPRRFEP